MDNYTLLPAMETGFSVENYCSLENLISLNLLSVIDLINSIFLECVPHGDNVLWRHVGLDIVNCIEYITTTER